MEQDIQVRDEHTTLLEIVLGSVFSSLEKLRRQPDQQVSSDDWSWVLRTSAATRPVLRWQDGDVVLGARANPFDKQQDQSARTRLEFTSGSDHPGSISNLADTPGSAFAYDYGLGGPWQSSDRRASSATTRARSPMASSRNGCLPAIPARAR